MCTIVLGLYWLFFLHHHAIMLSWSQTGGRETAEQGNCCLYLTEKEVNVVCTYFTYTGWSRKIETVTFGCVYSRGRIGFKISMCKIRLIILHSKYHIPFQIILYARDFYNTSKLKVRPLCAMPHFLLKAL